MDVSSVSAMQQQTRKMDGSGGAQGGSLNRMMRETIQMLPEDMQSDIKSLMQTLDPVGKKEITTQMAQIESSNMTVEDLSAAIMKLFNQTAEAEKSSYPASFSAYA
ncbi:MAG: hypothetical protein AUK54_02995 [Helicobacteraceae bacterium CG2_30_36_10]|nr:MAG: hypothetical protein AUK54_02995 [Helicobacteraceae bacterium CG2_30_36_10]